MSKAKSKPMTAAQFVAAVESLGLNQAGAAAFLGIGMRTCSRYYSENGTVPHAIKLLLTLMIARGIKPEDVK